MPIEVQHSAGPAAIAAAFASGSGQRAERDARLRAQLSMDAARLSAQIAQQNAELQFRQQQAFYNNQLDAGRLGLAYRGQNLDYARLQAGLQSQQWDALQQQKEQERREKLAWEQRSALDFEEGVNEIQAEFGKQAQNLTPQGRQLWADLSGKLRAIQSQRAELRPGQYGQLLGQWSEEFQRSGVEKHIQRQPTIEEQWKQSAVEISPGVFAVRQPDGKWVDFAPKAQAAGDTASTPGKQPTMQEYFDDNATFEKEYQAAEKSLTSQAKAEYDAAMAGLDPNSPNAKPPTMKQFTKDDVLQEMKDRYARRQQFREGLRGDPPTEQEYGAALQGMDSAIQDLVARGKKNGGLSAEERKMAQELLSKRDSLAADMGRIRQAQSEQKFLQAANPGRAEGKTLQKDQPQAQPQNEIELSIADRKAAATGSVARPAQRAVVGSPGGTGVLERFMKGQRPSPQKAITSSPAPANPPGKWTADKIQAELKRRVPNIESGDRELLAAVTPQLVQQAADAGEADPIRFATTMAYMGLARKREQAAQAASQTGPAMDRGAGTPNDRQLMAELPRVQSKAEVDKLPSGALFVGPDGKVRRKS